MASRKLTVEFLGDTAGLEKSLARANARLKRFEGQTKSTNEHVGLLGSGLKKAAGAAAGMAAGFASINAAKDAVNTTEELGHATLKLHNSFGLSIKSAGEFAAVMRARNVDSKQGAQAFKTLASNVVNAENGSKGAIQTFKLLGISVKDLKGKDFAGQLGLVSDGLKKVGPGVDKVRAASGLLGRGWQTLTPLLSGGSAAMREQLDLASRYGATLGGKTVKQVEAMIEAQRKQKLAMMGIQVSLGSALLPLFVKATTAFSGFVLGVREGTGAGGRFRDKVTEIWRSVKPTIDAIVTLGKGVGTFAAKHPQVIKLAASMAAVGLAIKSITFASRISGLSAFLGAARTGAATFRAIWSGAGGDAARALATSVKTGLGKVGPGIRGAAASLGTGAGTAFQSAFAIAGVAAGIAFAQAMIPKLKSELEKHLPGPLKKLPGIGYWLASKLPVTNGLIPKNKKAAGGPIMGGTAGKDSVPALLMPGEHVLTSREVRNAGGHGAIYAMRRALGGGGQGGGGLFAAGGAIESMKSAAWRIASKGYDYAYGGGHGGIGSPGYDIRGNGKFGFDCSGYVSAILGAGGVIGSPMAVRQPLQGALLPANGPNDGPVVVGIRGTSALNAHTMMRIGSSYYESGSGHGPRKVGGWSGSFDWFKPAGMSTAGGKDAKASGNPGGSGGGKTKVKRTRGFKPTGSSFVPSTAEGRYQTALATPGAGDDLWAANAGLNGANSEVRRASKLVAAGLASPSLLSDAMTRRDTWAQRVTDATEAGGNPLIAANIGGALMGDNADPTSGSASSSSDLLQGIKDELAAMNKRAEQIAQTTGGDVIRGLIHEFATTGVGTSFNLANQAPGRGAGAHASY